MKFTSWKSNCNKILLHIRANISILTFLESYSEAWNNIHYSVFLNFLWMFTEMRISGQIVLTTTSWIKVLTTITCIHQNIMYYTPEFENRNIDLWHLKFVNIKCCSSNFAFFSNCMVLWYENKYNCNYLVHDINPQSRFYNKKCYLE